MIKRFQVADVIMEVSTKNRYILKHLEPFASSLDGPADLKVDILAVKAIGIPDGERVVSEDVTFIKRSPGGSGYFGYYETRQKIFAAIDADAEWKNIKITYMNNVFPDKESNRGIHYFCTQIAGAALTNHLLFKSGLVLHASCILYDNKGIAFTAPSGTGKSTHASLWEEHKPGTVVLNDDTPAIRLTGGKPIVYGTPWSGSRIKFKNASAPLSAIVILEQAREENSITKVAPVEAVKILMPRFILPYYERQLMDMAVKTLEGIIAEVPIYHLKCKPDAEAVELVYECVK
ncbi:MAG: hypothetical protein ACOX4M_06685 [Acetivibrionales bacterium]|jgi:hypothetical protein